MLVFVADACWAGPQREQAVMGRPIQSPRSYFSAIGSRTDGPRKPLRTVGDGIRIHLPLSSPEVGQLIAAAPKRRHGRQSSRRPQREAARSARRRPSAAGGGLGATSRQRIWGRPAQGSEPPADPGQLARGQRAAAGPRGGWSWAAH
ncbi:hypothetical protein C2845_PM10G14890 [Panicum miliaceum]|uniref:Uncharacterized protein n=1 Tax=Panicum miliaceum TaxID=4540 RepID=A0A3L6PFC4_PANMI|nr:hypothetical protein C2845_PM10G14890 [Panicum miliaceum]